MTAVRTGSRYRQRGLSLVEMFVAMILGLLVVGGVLLAFVGSGISSRQLRALAEMTQDAQMALALMGRDIQVAGFVEPASVSAGAQPIVTPVQVFRPVFGCDTEFVDPKAGFQLATCSTPTTTTPTTPTTPTTTTTTTTTTTATTLSQSALEVNYQVSAQAHVVNSSSEPVDCKGDRAHTLTVSLGKNTATRPFVSNRYYVSTPTGVTGSASLSALYCASQTGSPAPLVDKVQQLRVFYGVSTNWRASDPATWRPQRYVSAADVASAQWASNVVAVRLCVLIRSAEPVLQQGEHAGYLDCDQAQATSTDRHLYRAFFSTVAIRNKVNR